MYVCLLGTALYHETSMLPRHRTIGGSLLAAIDLHARMFALHLGALIQSRWLLGMAKLI